MKYYYYDVEKLKKNGNKKVYLYPAGYYTEIILKTIKDMGIYVDGVIDQNRKIIDGKTTISVADVIEDQESIIYITSTKYGRELYDNLVNNGYKGKIEFFFKNKEKKALDGSLVMERMDLVLTSKCTLRCEKCANLMQYYEHPVDVDFDIIKKSMTNLVKVVDEIGMVNILGGEPFIYKSLKEVALLLKSFNNINQFVIITNGTVCPEDPSLWKELHNERVMVHISDYGKLSRKKNEIVSKCIEYGINCEIEENKCFYDTGSMQKRNRAKEDLDKVFSNCGTQCRSLFKGELHYCPRSSHGVDLGIVCKRNMDYVDLLGVYDNIVLREKIEAFLNRTDYVEACDYCDIRLPGYYEHEYPAAVQAKHVLKVGE